MKPVSFSMFLPSASVVTAESCLERRFSLFKIDLKPLDEVGEVGDVGSVEEGAVTVESCVGAVTSEALTGAVGSSYRSSFASTVVAVARVGATGVATTAVPRAGAAREASLDLRRSSLAKRSSSALLVFSASFACFAAAFSSALRALAALFSSSIHC